VAKGGIHSLADFAGRCASREILVAKGGIHSLADFAGRCASREILVAKGGIEPPTQGFSGRPDKRDLILNQALATHAKFREQRHEGLNESNEARKSYDVATVPIY
jgi:hypothetical protein